METLKNLSGMQKFIIGLILGLVVGWAGTYAALQGSWGKAVMQNASKQKETNTTKDTGSTGDTSATNATEGDGNVPATVSVPGNNAVAVNDQPAGMKVDVTMATLTKPGWVVVAEDNNGMPGKILGAHRYDPGIYLAEVDLLRGTEAGKTYHVVLRLDDGDKVFDQTKDLPIMGEDGKVVETTFKAQ